MAYVVQDVVTIRNAESFTFQSVLAFACFLYSWETMGKTFETNDNVIPNDLPSLEDCFTTEFLDSFATQYDFQNLNFGCLYNTCRILDGSYMDLMEKLEDDKKHWAIGTFNPLVTSSTVENAVKTLMASKEGDEIRKRVVDMGEAIRRAMNEGGVSRMELDSFITHITR
ncbi:zeatin o-glucosyltransferase [Fagus crenata]